ncbi:MAG TPA: undecaprenyldiphospho-muramoylpentapeptide beta-N-acetylglucosaminyltransferase [Spirochaetia bacterium]|nr:undecaprenyldiphospho-muramoylpentapeptide beta-N-acetylglucosaminyltransferase [Spirochaetia bacterium]
MSRVVVFTGGGSGGHVFPGIAVIEKLKGLDPTLNVLWIGSSSPLEREIVARFGVRFISIPAGKLRRYFSIRNAVDVFKIMAGLVKSIVVLLRLRPPILFSKGGFVSVPPVIAASILGIPVFTHESDVDPGLATRINARFAERIFVAYEASREFFPPARRNSVSVSGNPVRREIFEGNPVRGRTLVGAGNDRRLLLLVLGGSQGAHQVNKLIDEAMSELVRDYFVVHQTGDAGFRPSQVEGLYRTAFLSSEYADLLAAADLVVGRSGAGTLWELAALGKPAILVPLASFSRGDQIRNAREFEARGAAVVLEGERATATALAEAARRLARNQSELEAMGRASRGIFRVDAAGFIADEIQKRIGVENANCTP